MSAPVAYRADIDGLRSIAVGSVIAFHAFPALVPGGFVGVDIFFVISGFLITGILLAEHARSGRIDLAQFYARRVRRLLPALLLVIVTTLIIGLWRLPADGELQSLGRSSLATLFFASNIFFALQPSGYFAAAAETHPLLHTWTLAVEEQFYIVWPLLIPLAIAGAGRIGIGRRTGLWAVLLGMFGLSLALSLWGMEARPTYAFYLTPFRAWEFAIGAMLALLPGRGGPIPVKFATITSLAGLGAIGIALWGFDGATPFPGMSALLPTIGAAALLHGGAIAPKGPVARLLALRPAVYIGRISYGWYLWHWPLLAFVRSEALGQPGTAAIIAAVVLSFVASAISYQLVETPIRHQEWRCFRTTRGSILAGIVLLAIGSIAAFATIAVAQQRLADRPRLQAIAATASPVRLTATPASCANYARTIDRLAPWRDCLLGDRGADRIVILIGDSHAAHHIPMLDLWGRRAHVAILPRVRGGCRPLAGAADVVGDNPGVAECARFLDLVLGEATTLAAKGHVAALVVGSRWPDRDVTSSMIGSPTAIAAGLERGLARLGSFASAAGLRLVLIKDTPFFPYDVPRCLARREVTECSIDRATLDRQRDNAGRWLEKLAATNRNVRLLDPAAVLCPGATCPPIRRRTVLFADQGHLSPRGSAALAAPLSGALDAAILAR